MTTPTGHGRTWKNGVLTAGRLASIAGVVFALPALAGGDPKESPLQPPARDPAQDPARNPLENEAGELPNPASVTGQDFAGIQFPLAPVKGRLEFHAQRAVTWAQPSETGTITRLNLTGDVRVVMGLYEFSAAEAVMWIQKIDVDDGRENVYQVFCYFDRVGTPAADASISVAADRLPVRAVVEAPDGIQLRCSTDPRPGPSNSMLLPEAERALARSIRDLYPDGRLFNQELARREDPTLRLRDELARIRRQSASGEAIVPGVSRPYEPESPRLPGQGPDLSGLIARLPEIGEARPIFAREGLITLAPGQITLVPGKDDNALVITDGLTVQYSDQRSGRVLEMTAQRAVVFLPPGQLTDMGRLQAGTVRGIYLEGDVVASDGRFTLRGPRVFYDVQANRAVVLDAVFWTYDQARRLPLYLRAKVIRQESDSQFTATKATLANTAFFEPDLSIGMSSLTIKRVQPDPAAAGTGGPGLAGALGGGGGAGGSAEGRGSTFMDAKDITFQAGKVPFFYFPRYKGDPTDVPLKDLRFENSSTSGATVKTTWDAQSLLGMDPVPGLSTDLFLDAYFRRGPGLGTRFDFSPGGPLGDGRGKIFAYTVIDDHGDDVLKPGTRRQWDGSTRGMFEAEGIWNLDEHWKLTSELSYIGDETFLDEFFVADAETRREFTSGMTLSRTEENTYFKFGSKVNLNDFIANEYLLQSTGFNVDRIPELSYYRFGDDLLSDYRPGLLSYSSEYRIDRMAMNFDKPTASQRGYNTNSLAQQAFGIGPNGTLAQALREQGYTEDSVWRLDTRHEFTSQLSLGPINITPFATLRSTYWDNDFGAYSPNETDNVRLWGSTGARFSTTIQKVNDSIDSRLLDLHRIRHIIEPNATIMLAGSTIDRVDLPEYDSTVEGIAEGTITYYGVNQTWQTQRGGPGRWHYVDVFTLDTGVTWASDDADRRGPITHFVDYRPEYSYVGNAWDLEGTWQLSDTYALSGSNSFDLDSNSQQRSSVGVIIHHNPSYSSFMELRSLNAQDSTVLDFGAAYMMTSKIELGATLTYDLNEGGFQETNFEVRRRFASALMGFNISYNEITNETGFGFVFQPQGVKGAGRLSGMGSNDRGRSNGIGG